MKKANVFLDKFRLFWRELGNILLNTLCPILSMLAAICELLHLPVSVVNALKKAEYWCFYAYGTKKVIDQIVEKVEGALEDKKVTPEEAGEIGHDIKDAYDKIRDDFKK